MGRVNWVEIGWNGKETYGEIGKGGAGMGKEWKG